MLVLLCKDLETDITLLTVNLSLTVDSHRHRLLLCCCSSCLFYFIHFGKYVSIKLRILLVVFSHFVLQNFVLNLDIPGNIHQTNINSNKILNWDNFLLCAFIIRYIVYAYTPWGSFTRPKAYRLSGSISRAFLISISAKSKSTR